MVAGGWFRSKRHRTVAANSVLPAWRIPQVNEAMGICEQPRRASGTWHGECFVATSVAVTSTRLETARWHTSLLLVIAGLGGCGRGENATPAPIVAAERSGRASTKALKPMRPLVPVQNIHTAPNTKVALAPDVTLDARVLVITADGTDSAFDAITSALGLLGTPYDVLDATHGPTLTDANLAEGNHGKYQAVFLDLGDLPVGGTSAFSDAEWMTLASYEARFGVRRVVLYASPSPDYGLQLAAEVDPSKTPVITHCTAAGSAAFVGANCAVPLTIDMGWAYPATATDAQTTPLLVDDAGHVLAATRVYPDGREALVLTFAQASYALHTLELGYGLVSWATRGLFIGEHHVYLQAQLDDFLIASAIFQKPTTYRCTADDLQALASWQSARRTNPLVANLRLAWATNAQGASATDPLTQKAIALGSAFAYISHTWDHADLTVMSYPDALVEFSRNDQTLQALGLQPYATENLVTPGITGLDNPNAMLAAAAAGVRQLVSDTSVAGGDNPSPNAGFCNALVPSILELPRTPTNLFFDVSLPDEWATEYAVLLKTTATYDQMIAKESQTLAGYLLSGNLDPWMFHQANIRDIGGGHSLLSDLLGAALDRYLAAGTFPVLSPTMDELATLVLARMSLDASGVIGDDQRLTDDGDREERRAHPRDRALHERRGALRRTDDLPPRPRRWWFGHLLAGRLHGRWREWQPGGRTGRTALRGFPIERKRRVRRCGRQGGRAARRVAPARPEALEQAARPGRWRRRAPAAAAAQAWGTAAVREEWLPRAARPERLGPVAAPEGAAGRSPEAREQPAAARAETPPDGSAARARDGMAGAGSAGTTGNAGNNGPDGAAAQGGSDDDGGLTGGAGANGSMGPARSDGSALASRRHDSGCAVAAPTPNPLTVALTALCGLALGRRRRRHP